MTMDLAVDLLSLSPPSGAALMHRALDAVEGLLSLIAQDDDVIHWNPERPGSTGRQLCVNAQHNLALR